MEILLRYNDNDKKELLISSSPENTFNELLKYLTKLNISYVDSVPEKQGIY
jgi:phosphatidate phosphatase APP1